MITTFVLIMSGMTPYGFGESSHYDQFATEAACLQVGTARKAQLPGTFVIGGNEYPYVTFRCERGRANHDIGAGWSNW